MVSIVPQVAAGLANTKPAPKRKALHEDETHGAKKPRRAPQVCTPADGGTHPAGARTPARVRSRYTRAQPRTHTRARRLAHGHTLAFEL